MSHLKSAPKIHITICPEYLEEESRPADDEYVFSYTITLCNKGKITAKLLNRHWIITDAFNEVQEVLGEGVVGERPSIGPGECYEYTSYAVLKTPVGSMEGEYEMITDDGSLFTVEIPPFTLAKREALH